MSDATPSTERKRTQLEVLLERLVPPTDVTVTDLHGRTYRFPAVVSARRQMAVVREVKGLLAHETTVAAADEAAQLVRRGRPEDLGAALVKIVAQVADDAGLGHVGRAFAAGWPEVVTQSATASGIGEPSDKGEAALDLFPVEELAKAILPLCVRLARTSVQALADVGGR